MPVIGPQCHELRITDRNHSWRIMYKAEVDRVLILEVFDKNVNKTPKSIIESCKRTLSYYDKFRREDADGSR